MNKRRDIIMAEVTAELRRAIMLNAKFHSAHEGYAVILEEVDELWEEIRDNDRTAQYKEGVQVAAMALRFLYDLFGDEPIEWG